MNLIRDLNKVNSAHVIAIDIGGTNIDSAIVQIPAGKIIRRRDIPTNVDAGYKETFFRLQVMINEMINELDLPLETIHGIGVGCAGPVDTNNGIIRNPYTLWDNVPIVDFLETQFALPTILINDAQAAALGEYWRGAGKGRQSMMYMTVSTGIGGGIIHNGTLVRGVDQLSGEIGHQAIDPNGPECYCGARGCLEMLAAAPAIRQMAIQQAPDKGQMLALVNGKREKLSAKIVYLAASSGDKVAQQILSQVGEWLGIGIANLLNIITLEIVVCGGGVMQGWSAIAPTMLKTIEKRSGLIPLEKIDIVPAESGLDAGIIGATYAIMNTLQMI